MYMRRRLYTAREIYYSYFPRLVTQFECTKDTFVSLASGVRYKVDYHTNSWTASRSISLIGHGVFASFLRIGRSHFLYGQRKRKDI